MYPYVIERIGEISQMRVDVCARLPADHPLQPPMIECIQSIPNDAEVVDEPTGSESANISTSSHPKSSTQSSEPSVIENMVNHYSGELPGVKSNQEKASRVPSDEVTLESPQQQAPNLQTTSTTCSDVFVLEQTVPEHVPDHIESHSFFEQISEPDVMITSEVSDMEVEISNSSSTSVSVSDKPLETNIQTAMLEQGCFTSHLLSFDNNKVLKIINWIC